jgi:hypothetical protein
MERESELIVSGLGSYTSSLRHTLGADIDWCVGGCVGAGGVPGVA